MKFFPLTAKKLRQKGKKVRAAASIGCFTGFLALLPVITTDIQEPSTPLMLALGYLLVFCFLVPAFLSFTKILNIERALFNDYSEWPPFSHWFIIIGSLLAVLILIIAKSMAILAKKTNNRIIYKRYGKR